MDFFKTIKYINLTMIALIVFNFDRVPSVLGKNNHKICVDSLKNIGFKDLTPHAYLQFFLFSFIHHFGVMENHEEFVTNEYIKITLQSACQNSNWGISGIKFCNELADSIALFHADTYTYNAAKWCEKSGIQVLDGLSNTQPSQAESSRSVISIPKIFKKKEKTKTKEEEIDWTKVTDNERYKENIRLHEIQAQKDKKNYSKCLEIMNNNGYYYRSGGYNLLYALLKYPLMYQRSNSSKDFFTFISSVENQADNGLILEYERHLFQIIDGRSRNKAVPPNVSTWCCKEEIVKVGYSDFPGNVDLPGYGNIRPNAGMPEVRFPFDHLTVIETLNKRNTLAGNSDPCNQIEKNDIAKQYCEYLQKVMSAINSNQSFAPDSPIRWCNSSSKNV